MNKNSLKQMIVAEMIYADARKLMNESYKKRSLFEMMDDDYLDELDDRKFVHSMKMMLEAEAGFGDADQANIDNPRDGNNRKPVVAPAPETVAEPKPNPVVKPESEPDVSQNINMIDNDGLSLPSVGAEPAEFAPDSLGTSTDHGNFISQPEDSGVVGTTAPADGTVNDSQPLYTDDLSNPVVTSDDGGAGGWVDVPDDDADDDDIVEPVVVEPVVEPDEEEDDSTIITIDGTKYYDGLKYLNKISDEMPAATAESRLSLVDALYA